MKKIGFVVVGILMAGWAANSLAADQSAAAKTILASGDTHVVLREYSRTMTLAPNEGASVTSVCLPGETVLSGGPTALPGFSVTALYSTLVFDGVNSGWTTEYRNDGTETVTVFAATGALCTAGTLTAG